MCLFSLLLIFFSETLATFPDLNNGNAMYVKLVRYKCVVNDVKIVDVMSRVTLNTQTVTISDCLP